MSQIVDFDSQIVSGFRFVVTSGASRNGRRDGTFARSGSRLFGPQNRTPPKWIKIHRVGEGLHMVGSIHCLLCEGCTRVWCGVDMLHDLF